MIIYEVAEIDVEEHNTVGMFTDRGIAERARDIASESAWHGDVKIIEHTLDVLEPMISSGMKQFTVWIYPSGFADTEVAFPSNPLMVECVYKADITSDEWRTSFEKNGREPHSGTYEIWATSEAEAAKIAFEEEGRRLDGNGNRADKKHIQPGAQSDGSQ